MMMRIFTVVLLFTSWTVIAAAPPPVTPFGGAITWQALSIEKPTTALKMGPFSVVYEKTTLGDIKRKVGSGQMDHQGDAGESVAWLCYTAQDSRIWIMSGEMGGSEHAVLNVAAESGQFEPLDECPALPANFQPVSFDRELWVGATENFVLQILGQPSHREGEWLSFDYSGKEPGACKPEDADIMNWALIQVKQGRVVQIHAGQVTSG